MASRLWTAQYCSQSEEADESGWLRPRRREVGRDTLRGGLCFVGGSQARRGERVELVFLSRPSNVLSLCGARSGGSIFMETLSMTQKGHLQDRDEK
jgi:hypothetical protein